MKSPFRYFKTSPEIIRLAVMMYVRFPLSLRHVEDLLPPITEPSNYMDTYSSFADLAKHAEEGRDFEVRIQERLGTTVIIAPHGGGIEPGTSEIAEAIAGNDLSLYLFEGIRDENNRELHITSTRFDEPRCADLVADSPRAIAIHGEECPDETVFLGGRDQALLNRVRDSLAAAGFHVAKDSKPELHGLAEANICNRVQSKRGLQVELSNGLRSAFFSSLARAGRKTRSPAP